MMKYYIHTLIYSNDFLIIPIYIPFHRSIIIDINTYVSHIRMALPIIISVLFQKKRHKRHNFGNFQWKVGEKSNNIFFFRIDKNSRHHIVEQICLRLILRWDVFQFGYAYSNVGFCLEFELLTRSHIDLLRFVVTNWLFFYFY